MNSSDMLVEQIGVMALAICSIGIGYAFCRLNAKRQAEKQRKESEKSATKTVDDTE
jgi:hypothetical protein